MNRMFDSVIDVIILAAGKSSRFWPLAIEHHKSLYKVGNGRTLIENTVLGLEEYVKYLGNILIVVSPKDLERVSGIFKTNKKVKIIIQNEAKGEGDALLEAVKNYSITDKFFLTTGDKINAWKIMNKLKDITGESIAVRSYKGAEYGKAILDKNNRILSISEEHIVDNKPGFRITSGYLLKNQFLNTLKKHCKEEYSLESALDEYIKLNIIRGVVVDYLEDITLKYPWHLLSINRSIQNEFHLNYIHQSAEISKTAVITGDVFIDEGVKIYDFVKITGPVYIGKNAIIGDFTSVRDCSFIDDDVILGSHSEIKNTIIYKGTHLHRNYIGDSIIDKDVRVGAGTVTANRRYDRSEIWSEIKNNSVSTRLTSFGSVIGCGTSIGVNCSLMPGVKLEEYSTIYPGEIVYKDVFNNQCLVDKKAS